MRDTRGITLIALIITIIVLLILAGISIATLTGENGILNKASQAGEKTQRSEIIEKAKLDIIEIQAENENGSITDEQLKKVLEKYFKDVPEEFPDNVGDLELITKNEYGRFEIKVSEIWNGTIEQNEIKKPVITDKTGANAPSIKNFAQKTYVTWDFDEVEAEYKIDDTQTTQPDNWYDYEIGKWANIKTTNVISDTENLEAYWVWIPRYEYIVPTSTTATKIEVKFIPITQKKPDEGYTIHPAFTNEGNGGFGDLDGIWVAKFEAVSNIPTANYGGENSTTLKVQIIPNKPSWRGIEPKNVFSVCRKMTNEGEVLAGSTVDSHMMKNTEWGACAILSQSKYGIYNPESMNGEKGNKEYQIWNNSSGSCITGSVGTNKDAINTSVFAYNSINGPKASTTGTVYGIYDMAEGSWEYVAGCLNGQENTKFGVTEENSKYVDLYTNSSNSYSNYEGAKQGDATKEVKGWNGDYSNFVNSSYPVFHRGGYYNNGTLAGVFAFDGSTGGADSGNGFRVVLVP